MEDFDQELLPANNLDDVMLFSVDNFKKDTNEYQFRENMMGLHELQEFAQMTTDLRRNVLLNAAQQQSVSGDHHE